MSKSNLCIFILIIFSTLAFSKNNYKLIKDNFIEKNYLEVIKETENLDSEDQIKKEELSIIRGISLYENGNYKKCRKTMLKFLDQYTNSHYKDYSLYYAALADFKNENYLSAAISFINLKNSSYKQIARSASDISSAIVRQYLSEEENLDLSELIFDKNIKKELLQVRNFTKVLVVLPLTGKDGDKGNALLNGIKHSLNTNKLNDDKEIKLEVVNSESSIEIMQKKVIKKVNSSRYDIIIGELRSDRTSALAGIASIKKIPLIAPTAANKNISEISKFIYQMNCSSYTMGQKIAQYAIDSLKYKTFAVIYPMNSNGKESTAGFIDKVLEKGCEIIAREFYYEAIDLTKQLTRTRERICEIDSLDVEAYMSEDSIKHAPVGIVDAIFLPIPTKDLTYIPHQVAYYNFKAKLLGTYGWDNKKELAKASLNIDSLVFVREGKYDLDNQKYSNMVFSFRKKYKRNPKLLELKGFDAMLLITNLIKENENISLSEKLKKIRSFEGINGQIHFAEGERSNSYLEMFRYQSRKKATSKLSIPVETKQNPLAKAEYNYNIGYIKIVKHKNKEAIPFLKKALELNPNYAEAYKALANAYFNVEDYDNAIKNYKKDLSMEKDNAIIYTKLGDAYIKTENYQNAKSSYLKAIELKPQLSEPFLGLAVLNSNQDNEEESLKYYKIAAELKNKQAIEFLKKRKKELEKMFDNQ